MEGGKIGLPGVGDQCAGVRRLLEKTPGSVFGHTDLHVNVGLTPSNPSSTCYALQSSWLLRCMHRRCVVVTPPENTEQTPSVRVAITFARNGRGMDLLRF